jgi:hypothetical protein
VSSAGGVPDGAAAATPRREQSLLRRRPKTSITGPGGRRAPSDQATVVVVLAEVAGSSPQTAQLGSPQSLNARGGGLAAKKKSRSPLDGSRKDASAVACAEAPAARRARPKTAGAATTTSPTAKSGSPAAAAAGHQSPKLLPPVPTTASTKATDPALERYLEHLRGELAAEREILQLATSGKGLAEYVFFLKKKKKKILFKNSIVNCNTHFPKKKKKKKKPPLHATQHADSGTSRESENADRTSPCPDS